MHARQDFGRQLAGENDGAAGLRCFVQGDKGRFDEVSRDVLTHARRSTRGVVQHLAATHGMPHQEQRRGRCRRGQVRLDERGDVGQDGGRGTCEAAVGRGVHGAAPSALVEGVREDVVAREGGE